MSNCKDCSEEEQALHAYVVKEVKKRLKNRTAQDTSKNQPYINRELISYLNSSPGRKGKDGKYRPIADHDQVVEKAVDIVMKAEAQYAQDQGYLSRIAALSPEEKAELSNCIERMRKSYPQMQDVLLRDRCLKVIEQRHQVGDTQIISRPESPKDLPVKTTIPKAILASFSEEQFERFLACLEIRKNQVPTSSREALMQECYRTIAPIEQIKKDWLPTGLEGTPPEAGQGPMGAPEKRVGYEPGLQGDLPKGKIQQLYTGRSQPTLYGDWTLAGPDKQQDPSRANIGYILDTGKAMFVKREMDFYRQRNPLATGAHINEHRKALQQWFDSLSISSPTDRGAYTPIPPQIRDLTLMSPQSPRIRVKSARESLVKTAGERAKGCPIDDPTSSIYRAAKLVQSYGVAKDAVVKMLREGATKDDLMHYAQKLARKKAVRTGRHLKE